MRKDTVSTLKTCNSTSQRTLLLFIASSFRATLCTLPKPSIKFSWVQLKFSDHRAFFNNFYILKGATTKNQYIVTHTDTQIDLIPWTKNMQIWNMDEKKTNGWKTKRYCYCSHFEQIADFSINERLSLNLQICKSKNILHPFD